MFDVSTEKKFRRMVSDAIYEKSICRSKGRIKASSLTVESNKIWKFLKFHCNECWETFGFGHKVNLSLICSSAKGGGQNRQDGREVLLRPFTDAREISGGAHQVSGTRERIIAKESGKIWLVTFSSIPSASTKYVASSINCRTPMFETWRYHKCLSFSL